MKCSIILAIILMIVVLFIPPPSRTAPDESIATVIISKKFKWEEKGDRGGGLERVNSTNGWKELVSNQPLPPKRSDVNSVWYQIRVPALPWSSSAMYIERVYGQHITLYIDNRKVYEISRNFMYDTNKVLLPLSKQDSGKIVSVHIEAVRDRIGIDRNIMAGDYQMMLKLYEKANLEDVILGSSYVFIAFIMIICGFFLNRIQLVSWITLSIIIMSIGVLILTYSPFLYSLDEDKGESLLLMYDVALFTLLPSMTLFFEKTVNIGNIRFIRNFRRFQIVFSVGILIFMFVNKMFDNRYFDAYYFVSVKVLGLVMIMQLILIVGSTMIYALRGNKDAAIFATGFAIFAIVSGGEMVWYYIQKENYEMFWWKWGVFAFVISLIIILGRKFAHNHEQIVVYSRELEIFSNELQRAEKMEIISELAASVAHEVRNPLQVTRGFLQLLQEKSKDKEKEYLTLALEELGRASNIITDFLTFAKPEIEQVTLLNISKEFRHIEGILIPLANFQGGKMTTDIPNDLWIRGNSSKFKQAFINMIKNSIEALNGDGQIHIWAYSKNDEVYIHIQDTGEGMNESDLARLGEPYFSNKNKGTGLGLMVTFRIIEAMHGQVVFTSEKDNGTEAVVRFPSVTPETIVPAPK
ncbi:sensor histidine kinase [Paenibacillus pini]|uniref:histidine kinase n=2 Tax=Paenibacillus TaxID=44249 RepID=W7YCE9_9BACL|nr:sporulation kinase B homolog 1 [Paenibacillus pini JCM 16418]